MRYLLDTNAVSDFIARRLPAERLLRTLPSGSSLVLSSVVVGELRFGIRRLAPGRRKSDLELRTEAFVSALNVVPVDVSVADEYVKIRLARVLAGRPMIDNDLWIAATAKAFGAVLVTRDQDFVGIPGLAIEDWTLPETKPE